MGFILKPIIVTIFFVLAFLVILGEILVDASPLVPNIEYLPEVGALNTNKFNEILYQRGKPGSLRISEGELEQVFNNFIDVGLDGALNVDIVDGRINIEVSAKIPVKKPDLYINIQASIIKQDNSLALGTLKVGGLMLPDWLSRKAIKYYLRKNGDYFTKYSTMFDAVQSFDLANNQISIVYRLKPEHLEQLIIRGGNFQVTGENRERLLAHSKNLLALINESKDLSDIALTDIFVSIFKFAEFRGGNSVEENRAALLIVLFYLLDLSVEKMLQEPVDSDTTIVRHKILLAGREDYAKHFLVSAGLAVSSGVGISQFLGVFKELDDSHGGGTGFSFADISVDRAGIRFGEFSVSSPENAIILQNHMSKSFTESMIIVGSEDLPENMSEEKFLNQYGGVDEPAYNKVVEEIDARIERLPMYIYSN